jgi:hypothetical protein
MEFLEYAEINSHFTEQRCHWRGVGYNGAEVTGRDLACDHQTGQQINYRSIVYGITHLYSVIYRKVFSGGRPALKDTV